MGDDDIELKIKGVELNLRSSFQKFLGEHLSPTAMDRMKSMIFDIVRDMHILQPQAWLQDLMVELGMVSFGIGCPRKVCEQLKALNNLDLEWLQTRCGPGPGNMIWLEWATRHGHILGWTCTQEVMDGDLQLEFRPRKPLTFVQVDLKLENKDD